MPLCSQIHTNPTARVCVYEELPAILAPVVVILYLHLLLCAVLQVRPGLGPAGYRLLAVIVR